MDNAISTLVGEDLEGCHKWCGNVAGVNGSIYGIPSGAHRVAKFNPLDKSIAHIGPDFGDEDGKWIRGAMTENGVIYCLHVTKTLASSRLIRIPIMSQN